MNKQSISVSIIVPVYNVEAYLKKCISSLVDQDLPKDDYEIIAVNDGSTDNSLIILENLKKEYSDILINIVSQENKGLSEARNTGLKSANGLYIIFVDSDDILLPNTLREVINLCKENNLDVLEFGASGVTDSGSVTFTAKTNSNNKVLSGEDYIATISYLGSACNKVYNLNFLNKNKLRFMPNVFIEDIEFNTRAVYKCDRIMATDLVIAHFLQRKGSITRTKNFSKSKKMIYDIFIVLNSINEFTNKEVTKNSKTFEALKIRVSSLIATMLIRVLKETKDNKIAKDILLKLESLDLYPTKHVPKELSKRFFLLFANNKPLFTFSCNIMCMINKMK